MFSTLWGLFQAVWTQILKLFGLGGSNALLPSEPPQPQMLSIFVRTNLGEQVSLDLAPDWSVATVKAHLAPQLNTTKEQIKLIFAGKELPDDLILDKCDLGQHSILHAVMVVASTNTGLPAAPSGLPTTQGGLPMTEDGLATARSGLATTDVFTHGSLGAKDKSGGAGGSVVSGVDNQNVDDALAGGSERRGNKADGSNNEDEMSRSKCTIGRMQGELSTNAELHETKEYDKFQQTPPTAEPGTVDVEESSAQLYLASDYESGEDDQRADEHPDTGITGDCGGIACQRLLCDASTVITIQLSEDEQQQLRQLKESGELSGNVAGGGSGAPLRPHFYVYCARPCAGGRAGKLRVRCAHCHGGAVTLRQDPSCWMDVLTPRRLLCSCAHPDCAASGDDCYAEFFFKCASHVTTGDDDVAVPLYLVRANLPGVVCLSCTDVATPVIVFQCEASHVMCLDCFVTYCLSKLSERQFTHDPVLGYTLPCPVNCIDSLIQEVHHFRLMGDEQYQRYQHWATEEAVLAAGGVLCPRPGCGHGLIPDPDCVRITCVGGCGFVFCRLCLQEYHTGKCWQLDEVAAAFSGSAGGSSLGFSVNASRVGGARWDVATAAVIQSLTKKCPACATPTERSGGCMHMVCTRASCRFNWCWVCHTEWTRDCMASHWFG